jgi:hypothetical protein
MFFETCRLSYVRWKTEEEEKAQAKLDAEKESGITSEDDSDT